MATTKVRGQLVDLNATGADKGLKIPSGTELNRPTAAAGQIRNNTNETSEGSASCEEYYNGTEWKKINNAALPPPLAFKTILYNGTSATHAITGVGFEPDLVWIKDRSNLEQHILNDSTRGAGNDLSSDRSNAEANRPTGFLSFDSDGFTLGTDGGGVVNDSARGPYVAWCWKANGGTTSSNTDGSITSTVQANQNAGFSIVEWTGNGGSNETVGHGLSSAPEFIIVKNTSASVPWYSYNEYLNGGVNPADYFVDLSSTQAETLNTGTPPSLFAGTEPTNSVFSVGSTYAANTNVFIAYCFHSVDGFSKFGTYSGTGVNGNNITVGFQPDWLMVKRRNQADNWAIVDSQRGTNLSLFSDSTSNELANSGAVTFTSTGFTVNGASGGWNNGSSTYIYMAFKTN